VSSSAGASEPAAATSQIGGVVASATSALSRELRDFLIQFSIALHRYAMYPEGHPSLGPTVDHVLDLLGELLRSRDLLSLGVARNQLVIEGVATDPKNPVLTELASRMHRHHIGAISFRRGISHPELHEFLRATARDADRSGQPLGRSDLQADPRWRRLRIYPLNYERLRLIEGEAAGGGLGPGVGETEAGRAVRTQAAQLWLGLARAALASGPAPAEGDADSRAAEMENVDPTVVAQAISAHQRDAAYDQVIVGYMLQIAEQLKAGQLPESAALRRRVSSLISSLESGTLRHLLDMGGDSAQRQQFLLNAAEGLAADAVVDLVQAAAATSRQTVSHSLLRMLQKLARHAEAGQGRRQATADASVREQIARLIADWSLQDPNPDGYRMALQRMSSAGPASPALTDAAFQPEPRRVIQMALEVDVMGDPVERAADQVVRKGELKWLLETLRAAAAPRVAKALLSRHVTPARIEQVLSQDPVPVDLLDELLPYLGLAAADPMLDQLIVAESSQTRRLLIDRLIKLGPDIGPTVWHRLDDSRWYVTRNMLALLSELPGLPEGFDATPYAAHHDARVRREALRILAREPATRDRAICLGLADPDDHCVRLALTAAARGCPDAALPLLTTRATAGSNPDQRITAIRVLAGSGHPAALETLLRITSPRRTLLGLRTPHKTREYLHALAGLNRFPDDPRARDALALAARSRDPQIVQAASTRLESPDST
jgi:hypothetical protein